MFKNLTSRFFRGPPQPLDRIEALQRRTDRKPSGRGIHNLFPVITPMDFLDLDWPGFIEPLGDLPFSLTWGVMDENKILSYVNHELAAYWEKSGVDWREEALQNLRRITAKERASHEFSDDDGRLFCRVLMNEDTFGPSRLLIPHLFEDQFGPDYRSAIPERSCAIVYPAKLTDKQRSKVDEIIQGCYDIGTVPMSSEHFEAKRFWVIEGLERVVR